MDIIYILIIGILFFLLVLVLLVFYQYRKNMQAELDLVNSFNNMLLDERAKEYRKEGGSGMTFIN